MAFYKACCDVMLFIKFISNLDKMSVLIEVAIDIKIVNKLAGQ